MNETFTCLILSILVSAGAAFADEYGYLKPKENEVAIHHGGVEIPLNRILLIRKDPHYCAVKFTRCWTEIDEERMKEYAPDIAKGGDLADHFRDIATRKYALYESYSQKGCTGDFSSNSLQVSKGTASWLPLRGPFRPFIYQPGEAYVKCCSFKLVWSYKTGVSFIPSGKYLGDYGIELAPTPWTDIKEVNVNDSRVMWYRYDARRKRLFIPMDNFWEEMHKNRSNEVLIDNEGIEVPRGRILLIRKNSKYCAVRFKKYWTEHSGKEVHATYESYYPKEGTDELTDKSVKMTEDSVYLLSPQRESNPTKRPENEQIKCGPIKLYWEGNGFVSFFYDGWDHDYPRSRDAIELAPTPWSDISQINPYDNRVMWYKYDPKRRNIYVPIDKLWEDRK